MKVLVAGAGGQLGRALIESVPSTIELIARDRRSLDVADRDAIGRAIESLEPAVVVNATAYTAVDKAEAESELAHRINAEAPGWIAEACRRHGSRLVHVSTDFVFDGRAARPYRPDDPTGPLSVYGATKLEGERRVLREHPDGSAIFRTAWLYDAANRNFATTMLRLMGERPVVRVVADQFGTPTSVRGLARAIWRAIEADVTGILHWTDAGSASWYDFAEAIRRLGQSRGIVPSGVRIEPISTDEYPTPAKRPAFSVLDKSATWTALGLAGIHWQDALVETLGSLSP
ncbi:MAG: dTDP-4-dehydrorhamnose reductase [Phycisphaerales bacterium]